MHKFEIRSIIPKSLNRYDIIKISQWYPWIMVYTAFVASISFFCSGTVHSYWYTNLSLSSQQSDGGDSRITAVKEDLSWIASSPALAAFIGTILSAPLMEFCGRRKFLVILTLPYIVGWFAIGFSKNVVMIHVGRAFTGLAIGLSKTAAPIYVSECSPASMRGMLGLFPSMMNALGILIGVWVGNWLDWSKLALSMSIFPILLLVSSLRLPESPAWLLLNKKEEKSFKSLLQLRGTGRDLEVQEELDEMRGSIEEMNSPLKCKDFICKKENWMVYSLMIFQQLCGVSAVLYYLDMIHFQTNSKPNGRQLPHLLDPKTTSFTLGIVHFVTFFISLPLIDHVGRRPLLIASGSLMALSHFIFALCLYLNEMDNGDFFVQFTPSWLPITSLFSFMAAFSLGFGPIPLVFMTEVFPIKTRSYLSALALVIAQIVSHLVLKISPILFNIMDSHLMFLIYAFICMLAVFFVIFAIPETKGKTLAELEKYFRGPKTLLERQIEGENKRSYEEMSFPQVYLPIQSSPVPPPIPRVNLIKLSDLNPFPCTSNFSICLNSPNTRI